LLAVRGHRDSKALALQKSLEQSSQAQIVIDEKNVRR
jgi:hypothetical protein